MSGKELVDSSGTGRIHFIFSFQIILSCFHLTKSMCSAMLVVLKALSFIKHFRLLSLTSFFASLHPAITEVVPSQADQRNANGHIT